MYGTEILMLRQRDKTRTEEGEKTIHNKLTGIHLNDFIGEVIRNQTECPISQGP
jgi:hypothetical protein